MGLGVRVFVTKSCCQEWGEEKVFWVRIRARVRIMVHGYVRDLLCNYASF